MPVQPSDQEQEYFAREEMKRRKKEQDALAARMAEEEKRKLKELHFMKCPKCGMDMQEYEYREIKLDRCSGCGGVFFDQGEMEQLLQRNEDFLGKFRSLFR
ncbi:MAG TPA: zf-TFIIB domain-containing protein [Thermoanaerobaculia bacterium]|nr:zf-TFIIB domain-containing protein [Thermoanaerobaculia bacterium]